MGHQVGNIIPVRLNTGSNIITKQAKILALKPGSDHLLLETVDGKMIVDAMPPPGASKSVFQANGCCSIGPTAYTRQNAAKALGYKHVKI